MKYLGYSLLGASFVFFVGCSWVDLKPEAAQIEVLGKPAGESCKLLGSVKVQTKSKVGFYHRSEDVLEKELEILALNEASTMDASAIVPVTEVTMDGSRRYNAYQCPTTN